MKIFVACTLILHRPTIHLPATTITYWRKMLGEYGEVNVAGVQNTEQIF